MTLWQQMGRRQLNLLTEIEMTFDNMGSDHIYMIEGLNEGFSHGLDMIQ